jgi:hypothetical protein
MAVCKTNALPDFIPIMRGGELFPRSYVNLADGEVYEIREIVSQSREVGSQVRRIPLLTSSVS